MSPFPTNTKSWQPPIELQRSTPREVGLTGSGRVVAVVMVLLIVSAVGFAVWMSNKSVSEARQWQAWQADAMPAQGEVMALRKRGRGDETKYYADYRYRVGDTRYTATASIRAREWRSLKQGDALPVFYLKSQPGQSWLPGHEPKGMPSWVGLLTGVALLIPAPGLAYAIHRQRRLLEEGRAARARVTTKKKVSHDRGSHYRIDYEFETLEGSRRTGKYNVNRRPPEVGDELIVLYHPDEEKWSAKYPLSLVRVSHNE